MPFPLPVTTHDTGKVYDGPLALSRAPVPHISVGRAGEPVTAVILAGGKSTRMGRDKSLMSYRGKPLIQHICESLRPHFDQMMVAATDCEKYGFLNVEVTPDLVADQGPIMGILSALEASETDYNFVIACDSPGIHLPFIFSMVDQAAGCDCVVPVDKAGKMQPLFAVYRKSALDAFWSVYNSGQRKVRLAYGRCRSKFVPFPRGFFALNINTAADAAQVRGLSAQRLKFRAELLNHRAQRYSERVAGRAQRQALNRRGQALDGCQIL